MASNLKLVFMGTPDFAVESLRVLHEAGENIVGVITAPDKPAGRGKKLRSSPVKEYSREAGIQNILQPTNLKDPQFLSELKELHADLQVVVAFRMLPEVVWSMPPKGTINLHASLLPQYRGAAPINHAIINGETETGVTTFFIEKDIDTGKIILMEKQQIGPNMTAGELHDKLMTLGGKVLLDSVRKIAENDFNPVDQQGLAEGVSLKPAPKIFKEDCRINWNNTVENIYNLIRGLSPYPAAWSELTSTGKKLMVKIYFAEKQFAEEHPAPGTLLSDGKQLKIAARGGFIIIRELQAEGKKRMNTEDFLRGFQDIDNYQMV